MGEIDAASIIENEERLDREGMSDPDSIVGNELEVRTCQLEAARLKADYYLSEVKRLETAARWYQVLLVLIAAAAIVELILLLRR